MMSISFLAFWDSLLSSDSERYFIGMVSLSMCLLAILDPWRHMSRQLWLLLWRNMWRHRQTHIFLEFSFIFNSYQVFYERYVYVPLFLCLSLCQFHHMFQLHIGGCWKYFLNSGWAFLFLICAGKNGREVFIHYFQILRQERQKIKMKKPSRFFLWFE